MDGAPPAVPLPDGSLTDVTVPAPIVDNPPGLAGPAHPGPHAAEQPEQPVGETEEPRCLFMIAYHSTTTNPTIWHQLLISCQDLFAARVGDPCCQMMLHLQIMLLTHVVNSQQHKMFVPYFVWFKLIIRAWP